MIYYVSGNLKETGNGTKEKPFQTIQEAAELAMPGDQVLVAPGIYREYVNPKHAGTEKARIEYRSMEPLQAVITGAEAVKNWERVSEGVWRTEVSNDIFGDYNPYTTRVYGDWFVNALPAHTGDVFLNHKSMYEVPEEKLVYHPIRSMTSWDADFSMYTWFSRQNEERNVTEFVANFGEYDPNVEDVEISVRKDCFLPSEEGIGYITLSGFTVREAATQWAPPTAYQDGMVGPHWSKGWIIEDCEIYESKCSGISLGKYLQPNNENKWSNWKLKDGTQTQRDAVCQASYEGWDKEHVGSHIVRRCNIHDCGQTGIVGHLGGVFSVIEENQIHHINNKQNLAGAEIGGIKMHAAIDTIIRRNHIHHCSRGLWLDWEAQGTRVTGNLFHDNCLALPIPEGTIEELLPIAVCVGEDIFVEVSHGPTLIDHNLLLSDRSLKLCSQGLAVVHNLIGGSLACIGMGTDNGAATLPSQRYTPYHVPHDTKVAGFMTFLHGDARFYNNVFVANKNLHPFKKFMEQFAAEHHITADDACFTSGTHRYDGYPTYEEWLQQFDDEHGMSFDGLLSGEGASDRYYNKLPVWFGGNYYYNGSKPAENDTDAVVDTEHEIQLNVVKTETGWKVETNLYEYLPRKTCATITTETLGMAFEPEERFENPDGTPIVFDRDYYGSTRGTTSTAGPIESGDRILQEF